MRKHTRPGSGHPRTLATLGRLLHDLRQPLTAIQLDVGNAILLLRQDEHAAIGPLQDALSAVALAEKRLRDAQALVNDAAAG